jgi:hypothetical protein
MPCAFHPDEDRANGTIAANVQGAGEVIGTAGNSVLAILRVLPAAQGVHEQPSPVDWLRPRFCLWHTPCG